MGEMEIFSVRVQNVQSIESLEFEFPVRESGGSFVTLVGPSSSGKSALLRALHALFNNTSSAAVLLRSGAKKFEIEAVTSGGPVKITRGASLSTYSLGTEDYTKSGTSVPEPVQKHLGFKEPDLHLRFQFDRPYLLDATSGQAAAALARLSHAHILRDAASKASKIVRQKSSEQSVLESEKSSAQQALSDLGDVEAQGQQVERINADLQDVQNAVSRAAQVQSTLTQVRDYTAAAASADDALSAIPDLSEQFGALSDASERYRQVSDHVRAYEQATAALAQPVPKVAHYMLGALTSAEEKFFALRSVESLVQNLYQFADDVRVADYDCHQAVSERESVASEIQQVRESMKVCPTCGQEVGAA